MKRNQVNAILVDQAKRRKTIFSFSMCLLLLFIITIALLIVYIVKNEDYSVTYKENSRIDYKVFLKDNSFFEDEFLGMDNKYIASLIDYITADFNYEIAMSEDNVDYKYKYKIESVVTVNEINNTKPLYTKTKELLNVDEQHALSNENVKINQTLNLDYNEYNDMIKNFVSIYGLDNVESTLVLNMYIDIIGSCDQTSSKDGNPTILSLTIPLTTKTVEIDIKNNIIGINDSVIICNEASVFTIIYLFLFIIALLISVFVLYKMIKYIIYTRTAENIYERELKKILNNYHSYIQKVRNKIDLRKDCGLQIDNEFIYKGCQFFKLETFTDMLEIRDSVNSPILMASNSKNTATYFIILDVINRAVYVYGLRINDIKVQMKNNETEKEKRIENK